jgi:tetratricopeptide (TPR) repeat protein
VRLDLGGFHERALAFCEASVGGKPQPLLRSVAALRLAADCCVALRRYAPARRYLETARSVWPPKTDRHILANRDVATIFMFEGELDRAGAMLKKELRAKPDRWIELALLFTLAVSRGSEEPPRGAFSVLDRAARVGVSGESAAQLAIHRAFLLCGVGKHREAHAVLQRARRTASGARGIHPLAAYAPLAVAGRWRHAARTLEDAAREESLPLWQRAFALLLAGILSEVGRDRREAESTWKQVERRFPPERVHYLSHIAQALREGGAEPGLLEGLPYGVYHRCELFYWAGLLFDRRGNGPLSKRLLHLAASEDPTLRWPTRLARRALGHLTQGIKRFPKGGPTPRHAGAGR